MLWKSGKSRLYLLPFFFKANHRKILYRISESKENLNEKYFCILEEQTKYWFEQRWVFRLVAFGYVIAGIQGEQKAAWNGFLKSWLRLGLGRQGLRLPPSAFLSLTLGFGSGFACLGYAVKLTYVRLFFAYGYEKKAVFSRKKSVQGNAHFSRKWNVGFLFRLRSTKTRLCKKVLYITRSYGTFLIPPPLATGNVP